MTGGLTTHVNNIIGGKLLVSNQNLVEKNIEVIHKINGTLNNFEEIFKFLSKIITNSEIEKTELRSMLKSLTKTDLRSIDILIYLIKTYPKLQDDLKNVMLKILRANKMQFEALMENFIPNFNSDN